MKIIFYSILLSTLFFSCQHKPINDPASIADTSSIAYPFTPKHLSRSQPGDDHNALIVLNCLKQYVAGNLKGCIVDFADTAEFIGDQFYFKGSKDTLAAILGQVRGDMVSISKTFDTWQTSYYPDERVSWVRLWYVEKWTDKKGKTDSLYYTDDVKLKDGKILLYDEKIRRFPVSR